MNACAIIAEYNPLHRGHLYHLEKSRELSGCSHVIAIMSGNFTQRGEPALVDKWARTRMALHAGADLVLELPVGYAVQPAEWFAKGAIGILSDLCIVTHLSFGTESGDLGLLRELAALLLEEPQDLSERMRKYLSDGLSHPAARSAAVYGHLAETSGERIAREAGAALRSPNNILGIHYLQALRELRSPIAPVAVRRVGSGYHARDIEGPLSSATAIRRAISAEGVWEDAVPGHTAGILTACFEEGLGPFGWENFEKMLLYRLRSMAPDEIEGLPDMAEGLHNRIAAAAAASGTYGQFIARAKVRRYAGTRLGRAAVHALLGVSDADVRAFRESFPRYARVLGLKDSARPLLSRIARGAGSPVVTRPGRFVPLSGAMERLWALDIRATDVYSLACDNEKGRRSGRDFTQSLIRL